MAHVKKRPLAFTVRLEGEVEQRFLEVKKKYGLVSNADLIRLLITEAYDRLGREKLE